MPPSIKDYLDRVPVAGRLLGGRHKARLQHRDGSELVTVVTIAFNSIDTIGRTIDSIVAQTYPTVEYIVIDGGSKDGTVDLLARRSDVIDLWMSEPDRGISDAFNKGIAVATGEYIALVNSDDWLDPPHLATAIAALKRTGADFAFGDLMFHWGNANPAHLLLGEADYGRRLVHAMPHINHPTVVCRRRIYEVYGLYDTSLCAAMDYEWLLRGKMAGVVGIYVPGMMSHMSLDGVSHRNYSRGLREVRDVSIRYGYPTLLAKSRYLMRLIKIKVRLALSTWVPRYLYEWLRRRVNAHYRSNGARAA